jgi:hypothetical protein
LTRFSSCHAGRSSLHDGPSSEHASRHRHVSRRGFSHASKWTGKQRALAPEEFSPISHIGAFEACSDEEAAFREPGNPDGAGITGGTGETCITACRPSAPRMKVKPVSRGPSSKAGVSASPASRGPAEALAFYLAAVRPAPQIPSASLAFAILSCQGNRSWDGLQRIPQSFRWTPFIH